MTPHLVKWHNKHEADGLVIIEIDNGRMDSLQELRRHVRNEGISYPVLHDPSGALSELYGIEAYPAGYLLDRSGRVIWEGVPLTDLSGIERLIERAVAEEG